MGQVKEFSFLSCNGKNQIYTKQWLPEGAPCGILQLVHGVGEHMGRYEAFASFLTKQGFVVYGSDHLGHGKSLAAPADLGYLEPGGWNYLVDDLHTLYQQGHQAYPALPYFLLGHSMGSFLVRTYLIRYPGACNGALLSGTGQMPKPLVDAGLMIAHGMMRRLGPRGRSKFLDHLCFGAYNKKFAPTRTPSDWLSRDEGVVDSFVADPLCGGIPSASLFCEMLGGLVTIGEAKNLVKMAKEVPVLFFSGEKDPVGGQGKEVQKVYRMFLAAGCRDVTLHLYPQGRHEMLNEVNCAQVYQDVLAWLKLHLVPSE